MLKTRRQFLRAGTAVAIGTAAAPAVWAFVTRSAGDDGPPSIGYGRDRCDACGMIVGDARFAAAAREGTAVHRYDDVGCLAKHAGAAMASGRATGLVHDFNTEGWVDAARAVFVRAPRIRTPMNYGIIAYADPAAARAAHPGLPVLSLTETLAGFVRERP